MDVFSRMLRHLSHDFFRSRRMGPFLVLTLALFTSACTTMPDPMADWTAEQLYVDAKEKLEGGNYESALKQFEVLLSRFPYGPQAEQAQLEIGYAYYRQDEPALAQAALDRFLRQYPTHENAPYALYLKGLTGFREERDFLMWLFRIEDDLADRDPRAARDSWLAFDELVRRFPTSRFAEDARARMAFLKDARARHNLAIAQFYLARGAHVAALNRALAVIEQNPRSASVEGALAIAATAYRDMGLAKDAEDIVRILEKNFPESRFLEGVRPTAGTPTSRDTSGPSRTPSA